MEIKKIYFDMDGVLADFERGVRELCGMESRSVNRDDDPGYDDLMWERIRSVEHFYDKLETIPEGEALFRSLYTCFGDRCEILTGIPKPKRGVESAAEDKVRWVHRILDPEVVVHTVLRREKPQYCSGKDCILIDDYSVNIEAWEAMGGTGILYENKEKTLDRMREIVNMDTKKILAACDHTLLRQEAVWEDVRQILDDAKRFSTASACISPCFVKRAKEYVGDAVKICTVIGFPNGTQSTAAKVFETRDAIANGADEIDMVIHIGSLKAGDYDAVLSEIREIKAACGDHILKVIIETCLLTEDEKIKMCQLVTESGADFIKTSTGFSTAGATFSDIELFKKHVGPGVKIKAAGGISSMEDAERFLALGADRLGTSRIVKLVKEGM